jgi:membrane associated rhomboid family serine protease
MKQASVGFHCPECAGAGKQQVFKGAPSFDPIVTKVLLGINVLAFLWSTVQSGNVSSLGSETLLDFGLFGGEGILVNGIQIGVSQGELYRIVTSGFLHDGFIHLGFNMYALWILGPQLERVLDRQRFVALYFVGLLGGATGVMLLNPDSFTVGASGAIFGLFGAVAVIQRASGANIWASGIGQVLAINLLFTFLVPRISVGGHLGGLLAGVAVGAIYIGMVRARQNAWVATAAAAGLGGVLLAAIVFLAANPIV